MNRAAELKALKAFFNKQKLPDQIDLGQAVRIINVKKFLESHFNAVEQPDRGGVHVVSLNRLRQVKAVLEENNISI